MGWNDGYELWMKTNLHQDVSSFILLNCTDGFFDKMLPNWFKTKFLGAGGQFGQVLNILKSGVSTFFINLDLFFECGLLILLAVFHYAALEGLMLIVFSALACLVIIPMFINYCRLFRNTTNRQKVFLFCGVPIFPIVTQISIIQHLYTKATLQLEIDALTMPSSPTSLLAMKISRTDAELWGKIEKLDEVKSIISEHRLLKTSSLANNICRTADELWMYINKSEKVKSVITKQRLLETSAEGQPQAYIKVILLLLTLSSTPNALIPETIFGKDLAFLGFPSQLVLTAFIILPILMNALFYLKTIDKKTNHGGKYHVDPFYLLLPSWEVCEYCGCFYSSTWSFFHIGSLTKTAETLQLFIDVSS